jgi:hypothetical protein
MKEDVEEPLVGNIKFEKIIICRGWRKVVGQECTGGRKVD